MLDPGHGGKDPGAIGVSGTYEKHVALAAALELKRQLEASGRYRVELTRTRRRVHPAGRAGRAGPGARRRAVRLHARRRAVATIRCAAPASTRSSTTASDAQTAALAQRENSADRFGGPHSATRRPRSRRSWPAWSGRRRGADRRGMAAQRRRRSSTRLPMLPNPARHAGFVVLKAADIPSVLVEMGFMSNPQDEAALRRPSTAAGRRGHEAGGRRLFRGADRRRASRDGWLASVLGRWPGLRKCDYTRSAMNGPLTAGERLAPSRRRRRPAPKRATAEPAQAAPPQPLPRAGRAACSAPCWRLVVARAAGRRRWRRTAPIGISRPTCRMSTGCAATSHG